MSVWLCRLGQTGTHKAGRGSMAVISPAATHLHLYPSLVARAVVNQWTEQHKRIEYKLNSSIGFYETALRFSGADTGASVCLHGELSLTLFVGTLVGQKNKIKIAICFYLERLFYLVWPISSIFIVYYFCHYHLLSSYFQIRIIRIILITCILHHGLYYDSYLYILKSKLSVWTV